MVTQQTAPDFEGVFAEEQYRIIWYFLWEWEDFRGGSNETEAAFLARHRRVLEESGLYAPRPSECFRAVAHQPHRTQSLRNVGPGTCKACSTKSCADPSSGTGTQHCPRSHTQKSHPRRAKSPCWSKSGFGVIFQTKARDTNLPQLRRRPLPHQRSRRSQPQVRRRISRRRRLPCKDAPPSRAIQYVP